MLHHQHCPACNSGRIKFALSVKDHTVSNLDFQIWQCQDCGLRFTQDIPGSSEIGDYYRSEEYVSHTESRQGLINKIYHQVRQITLRQKRKLVERHSTGLSNRKLLDIGCGTGAFLETMKHAGWEVQGLEPDEGARNIALSRKVNVLAPEALFTLQDQYSAISMWHVLEHVHDLHGYLDRIAKLLVPNGVLYVAVPNYMSFDAQHYGVEWAAYDVPRHLYHFSPASMEKLVAAHGMEITETRPMWFDSFYVSMLSEKYKHGSLFSALLNGLRSNIKAWGDTRRCSSVIYLVRRLN